MRRAAQQRCDAALTNPCAGRTLARVLLHLALELLRDSVEGLGPGFELGRRLRAELLALLVGLVAAPSTHETAATARSCVLGLGQLSRGVVKRVGDFPNRVLEQLVERGLLVRSLLLLSALQSLLQVLDLIAARGRARAKRRETQFKGGLNYRCEPCVRRHTGGQAAHKQQPGTQIQVAERARTRHRRQTRLLLATTRPWGFRPRLTALGFCAYGTPCWPL